MKPLFQGATNEIAKPDEDNLKQHFYPE